MVFQILCNTVSLFKQLKAWHASIYHQNCFHFIVIRTGLHCVDSCFNACLPSVKQKAALTLLYILECHSLSLSLCIALDVIHHVCHPAHSWI